MHETIAISRGAQRQEFCRLPTPVKRVLLLQIFFHPVVNYPAVKELFEVLGIAGESRESECKRRGGRKEVGRTKRGVLLPISFHVRATSLCRGHVGA